MSSETAFYHKISQNYTKLHNVIFWFKTILINKDTTTVESNRDFDAFNYVNYEGLKDYNIKKIHSSKNFNTIEDNSYYSIYQLKWISNYDNRIYSPKVVNRYDSIEDYYNSDIDINSNPLIINKALPYINNNDISSVNISYKKSPNSPNKYLIKISDFKDSESFIIHFNQSFSKSWKLKWIDKKQFENIKCNDSHISFTITNNSYCNYSEKSLLKLDDYSLLKNKWIDEGLHFSGNFIWNSWLISKQDIPWKIINDDELFAIIIYNKQLYYTLYLTIIWLSLIIILLITIIEECLLYIKRFHNEK